jgi:hypothetical protein
MPCPNCYQFDNHKHGGGAVAYVRKSLTQRKCEGHAILGCPLCILVYRYCLFRGNHQPSFMAQHLNSKFRRPRREDLKCHTVRTQSYLVTRHRGPTLRTYWHLTTRNRAQGSTHILAPINNTRQCTNINAHYMTHRLPATVLSRAALRTL